MSIYNRRNAAVGYVTLKAVQRAIDKKRQRRRRSNLKIAAYIGLGVVSAGILAGVLALALRRRQGDTEIVGFDAETEIVGEYVTAPEPVPAT